MIEILSTPTGFLRVRAQPSTLSEEVGKVEPGQTFPLLEQDEKTGWFKIEFSEAGDGEPAQAGWISNQYAKKVEEGVETPTATSSATPKVSPTKGPTPTPTAKITPKLSPTP